MGSARTRGGSAGFCNAHTRSARVVSSKSCSALAHALDALQSAAMRSIDECMLRRGVSEPRPLRLSGPRPPLAAAPAGASLRAAGGDALCCAIIGGSVQCVCAVLGSMRARRPRRLQCWSRQAECIAGTRLQTRPIVGIC